MSHLKINELLDELAFQADELTRKKIEEIKNLVNYLSKKISN
jgi:hypothetical protein